MHVMFHTLLLLLISTWYFTNLNSFVNRYCGSSPPSVLCLVVRLAAGEYIYAVAEEEGGMGANDWYLLRTAVLDTGDFAIGSSGRWVDRWFRREGEREGTDGHAAGLMTG
jgi:hypothetical protein